MRVRRVQSCRRPRHSVLCRQQGFALLELAVAAAIVTMLTIWAASALANRLEDARSEATGRWLLSIRTAAMEMASAEYEALAGLAPAKFSYSDLLAPTLAELQQAGHLAKGFPLSSPFGHSANVHILTNGGCPGENCLPEILVTTLASTTGKPDDIDPTVVGQVLLSTQGYGGAVHAESPERVRGAVFDLPNTSLPGMTAPLPVGTVAAHGGADSGLHTRFVRMRDSRDPDLQGALSVRKDVQAGGALSGQVLGLQAVATPGAACSGVGVFSRSTSGNLLSCQRGRWAYEDGGFGGAYASNNRFGCRHYTGVSTANPRTGRCSCPAGYSAVIVSAGGKWTEDEGWTTGYVCVR